MLDKSQKKRIVVGVSGASGAPLAFKLLKALNKYEDVEIHLVVTNGGIRTIQEECENSYEDFCGLCDTVYDNRDIGAAIASGSYRCDGMIVLPCSMKTLAGIASGYSDNLLLRAADVMIKEQRRLVLAVRESPFSSIHLANMSRLSAIPGVFIAPPVMSYYHMPDSLEAMEGQLVGRYIELLKLDADGLKRWQGRMKGSDNDA